MRALILGMVLSLLAACGTDFYPLENGTRTLQFTVPMIHNENDVETQHVAFEFYDVVKYNKDARGSRYMATYTVYHIVGSIVMETEIEHWYFDVRWVK